MISHGYENGYRTLGRQILLEPIRWSEDDWPEAVVRDIGGPIDAPSGAVAQTPTPDFTDDFSQLELGRRWTFHAPGRGEAGRLRVDDGLVLRGKGTSPADTSPLAMLTGDHAYEIEVDVSIEPGVEAGLLLFFNNRLFCGMGIDGERMLSYSGGIRTHWREPAPATDRITLRIRNDEHIVTGWYRVPGGEWTRHAIRYETSGYHVNTVGDLLSLRPALYATGSGEARFRDFTYRTGSVSRITRPHDRAAFSAEAPFALRRDGAPALLVGGQVFNSASSSPKAIADSFAHVRRVGSNVVLSPVSWALSEPVEGAFDFTLVDIMLAEARRNELRLVLLWFGAFKNAASTYSPTWVRSDPGGSRAWWSSRRACRPSPTRGRRPSRCFRSSAQSCAKPTRRPSKRSSGTSWMPIPTARS